MARGHQRRGRRGVRRQPDPAAAQLGEVGQLLLGHVQLDRQRVRAREQHPARLGELDTAGAAEQQRAAGERSSARRCWLTAGWVQPSSRAAALIDPARATARKISSRLRQASISTSLWARRTKTGLPWSPAGTDHGGMQTIGLIGGMSWHSTAEYYRVINELVAERRGGHASAKVALQSLDFAEIRECQVRGDWAARRPAAGRGRHGAASSPAPTSC